MNKKIMLLILGFMLTFSTFTYAYSDHPPFPGMPPKPLDKLERLTKELSLTPDQKAKFLENSKEIEKQAIEIEYSNFSLRDKMENELAKDVPDSKLIYKYMEQLEQNFLKMRFARINNIIELKKMLTPEQQKKFKELISERKKHEKKGFKKPF